MRGPVRRVRGLLRRYRTDRRLPPPVKHVVVDTARLRVGDRARRAVTPSRTTAGGLPCSTHALAHAVAERVVDVLRSGGVDVFVVERRIEGGDRPLDGRPGRRLDGLRFGVALGERSAALDLLVGGLSGEVGWHLVWRDGGRSGTVELGSAATDRHVRRARSWVVCRLHDLGERTVGEDQGAELTFWEPGSSGLVEMVGTRGQERFDPRCEVTTEVVDGHEYPGRSAFPVGATFEEFPGPVDLVYTWVDGADPEWLDAFRRTAREHGRSLDHHGVDPARYRSRDELRYSLRSAWAYCGWVGHIWLVTAGQRPDWLDDHPDVTVVDHREIIPADALPTFNSHSIEASLHHIDGLAEHFLYVNDDMVFGRPLRPEAFFEPNGLARVFQSEARVPGVEDEHTLAVDTAARRGRELLRQRFGRVVTHKPLHAPYPLRRSVMAELDREFPDVMTATVHSRFRSPTDLSTAASFGQHYALATGRAVSGHLHAGYAHVESGRLGLLLDRLRLRRDLDVFCINETFDAGSGDEGREARIGAFFEAVQPLPAPWERTG